MPIYSVAVLTVSDTASKDPSLDRSGPAITTLLSGRASFAVRHNAIVPDNKELIQAAVRGWADIDWVITTGGTGFGLRDVTPEAISPLIERPAPGLVHLLLESGLKKTPLAALSRPVAGVIGRTLIVTLPGSVKAVNEGIETLLEGGVVSHALELLRGSDGKGVHKKLQGEGSS